MNALLLQFFFVLLLSSSVNSALVSAEWSEWVETPDSPCSDTCGYCGVRVIATRTCANLKYCSGVSQRYEECAPKMCSFPRSTCCAGYVKGVLGSEFECVPATAVMPAKTKLA
ncbi:hypothetical protein PRIPAC_75136 [Pristionchus pacificus]|uniref:Uncharacterized protein n=1 Tax=Pristionchus pacificus TaxID=54126 RepID=A0A2A6C9Y8_PRIPA|nr:hypothetical protein PRIPAC_75136 [Pristionchus pacificus]|eukprot:PDM74900.1 hypothetical protein PRIPAC_40281 [Pristionchus pacificus]